MITDTKFLESSFYDKSLFEEESTEYFDESMLKDDEDIYWNKDKFDAGQINLCFITGLSGSGKSTMGSYMAKDSNNLVHTDMDNIVFNCNFTDEELSSCGEMAVAFFNADGKKYRLEKGDLASVTQQHRTAISNAFVDFAKRYAGSHKNKKFVVEGVYLFWLVSPDKIKDYAVYIKGTSSIKSAYRAVKRDAGLNGVSGGMKTLKTKIKGLAYNSNNMAKYRKYYENLIAKTKNNSKHESLYDEDFFSEPLLELTTEEPPVATLTNGIAEVRDTEDYFNPSELENSITDKAREVDELIRLSSKDAASCSVITVPADESYIASGAYHEYLESVIDNEIKIHNALTLCGLQESNNLVILNEAARLQDFVSKKWDAFLTFINGIIDRFWIAMNKLVSLRQKQFIENNKEIILNKKPREDMEYSYQGDYTEAVSRCMNTHIVEFNYERDAEPLRQEGYSAAVKDFMAGKGIQIKGDEDLAKQFKNWFLAIERGESKGKFSNLNMKAIYNFFITDYKNIEDGVKKDQETLKRSKNSLLNAINKILRGRGENINKNTVENQQPKTTTTGGSNATSAGSSNNSSTTTPLQSSNNNNTAQNASAIIFDDNWMALTEADNNTNNNSGSTNNDNKPADTGLKITNNGPDSKDTNGNNTNKQNPADNKPAGKMDTAEQDINNITTKWINVCRAFDTAKLTAIQKIAKDYMEIIKAHIRSYGGDVSDATENKDNNNQQNSNNEANNTKTTTK